MFHARTKHVEVHYHFIREKVLKEETEMQQIKKNDQAADLFTQGLNTDKHGSFRHGATNEDLYGGRVLKYNH